ncbi:hypothetical protein JW968_06825 [Candidatus Woesearchaeota archaeon]|nr:hypothetical protein [Candidatus Woesearchaeota archaeon]
MDVAKLMKMNKLTEDLKKHGMAESSEDAFAQAEDMINRDKDAVRFSTEFQVREASPSYPKPQGYPQSSYSKPQSSQPIQQPTQQGLPDSGMRSNLELNAFVKRLHTSIETQAKQIDFMQNRINDLLTEISNIKQKLNRPEPVIETRPKEEVQATFRSEPRPEMRKVDPCESSPRSGKYTPEDVSIEKMFYMGSKK